MPTDPNVILAAGQGVPAVLSPQQVEQQGIQHQAALQQLATGQALEQDRKLKAAQMIRQQAGQEALAASVKKHLNPDPLAGSPVDYEAVARDLEEAGFSDLAGSWLKTQNENRKALDDSWTRDQAHAKAKLGAIGDLAYRSKSLADFTASVGTAATWGLLGSTPQENEQIARQVLQQVTASGGDSWQSIADHFTQFSPAYLESRKEAEKEAAKVHDVGAGSSLVSGTGAVVYQGTPKAPDLQRTSVEQNIGGQWRRTEVLMNPDPKAAVRVLDLNGQPIENPAQTIRPLTPASITIRNDQNTALDLPSWALDDSRPVGSDANKMDPKAKMTPNGLYQASVNYIANGQFPPTGRGSDPTAVAQRAAITSKVGAIAAAAGMDEPALRAFYKANGASLTQQQKAADSVQQFMATADKNAALLATVLKNIPDTGSPLLNKPLRDLDQKALGSVSMAQFKTYLQSISNEYGRIISQPNLSGQLTDSARKEAETLVDPSATVAQLLASLDALKQEGTNRMVSIGDQIQRIQQRMSMPGGAKTAPAAPVLTYKLVDGKWVKQ